MPLCSGEKGILTLTALDLNERESHRGSLNYKDGQDLGFSLGSKEGLGEIRQDMEALATPIYPRKEQLDRFG